MPRKRQTITGDDAQNISSVPGQRYGEGKEQQSLQQEMPAPDTQQPVDVPPGAAPVGQPVVEQPRTAPDQIQAFLANNNPNLLAQSDFPDEPVTEGLSMGPGSNTSAIRNRPITPLKRFYENLARDTGDSRYRLLAEKVGL